jgi:hypothetical protein
MTTGYRWANGADPYWNSLMNQLSAAIGNSWYGKPPPTNYVRQAVDYLGNAMMQGCPPAPVRFGNVTAYCEIYWEDIVEYPPVTIGPFFFVTLWLVRS